ncbi:MAG: 4Fe-4S dicluster domain-containing protein [Planctomycetes bacterium]|nr:4Fe-4S dicluster domain-containing protein [Planctomycetota bacterium]
MRHTLVIDLFKCIGCQTCAVVCHQHNSQPPGTWWNRVLTPGSEHHQVATGKYPFLSMQYLPLTCMHCDNAPCVKVCPVKATYQRKDGVVLVDYERCIGCRYCMTACPYGVRQFNWQNPDKEFAKTQYAVSDYVYGLPEEHRSEGRLVYMHKRPKGVVEKCTLCVQYIDQGIKPACVRGCPGNARFFGDLDDPNSQVSKLVRERGGFKLMEEYGTKPKVFYLPPKR